MKENVHEYVITLEKEWTDALNSAFKKKNKGLKVDGFRKGTCPKDVYIKKFGIESLYMDAVDIAISVAYRKLLSDNKDLDLAVEPKVDISDINEKSITYKFTIITRPTIKLGEYKNLGIEYEKPKITKKLIDEEIKRLQNQTADLVIKDNGTIVEGNTAIIDFKGYVDGQLLEGGSGENYPLEIGSHSFIPGFEEGLIGHKTDETLTLNLKFPEDYVEHLKGKDVKFDVTIKEIKERIVPELNEEFYKDLGYDDIKTEEDFRNKIKEELLEEKEAQTTDEFLEKCMDKACENMQVDINEEIIDEEVHHMIHEYEDALKRQGLDIDKYYELTGTSHEDLHKQMEPNAVKRIKARYLIEEVAKAENIDFTDKEVKEEANKMAEGYGISVDELIKSYGSLEVVKYDLKMRKALDIIKESNK